MKHNNKKEMFFKNLASSYSERAGEEIKKEMAGLDVSGGFSHTETLDKKLQSGIRAMKIKKWAPRLIPAAACIIFFIIAVNINFFHFPDAPNNAAESAARPSETLTFEFVGNRLPPEYVLGKIDYDYQKVIYYIAGENGAEIVLTIEEFTGSINTEGLERIKINNSDVYGISNEGFSFIQFEKDNLLYMLTSPGDYYDIIKISENLI